MFSNIKAVNILTAILQAHGVRHAVLCPGSRNAPICHNLAATGTIECHPITDERSAGFYAIGLSQAHDQEPVAVCVTSGSAILDVSPAVAEAYYQRTPLIVIAADRPAALIGQLDGQTMPQAGALGSVVRRAVSLPEGETDEDLWYANRLVNEAMMDAMSGGRGPVLINVPLHEPLYQFDEAALPEQRKVTHIESSLPAGSDLLPRMVREAERPMMVIGHTNEKIDASTLNGVAALMPVFAESISSVGGSALNECAYALRRNLVEDGDSYAPDLVIYAGGTLVGKETKAFFRGCKGCATIQISPDGELHDVFKNTTMVIRCSLGDALRNLSGKAEEGESHDDDGEKGKRRKEFTRRWAALEQSIRQTCQRPATRFSQLQVVQRFAGQVSQVGNSSAVRLVCLAQRGHAFCNRGINGIDGSLSTAAGYAAGQPKDGHSLCVIGDLSFFYDQNGLWNNGVDGRLRILLLNNGGGGIFSRFEGLKKSPARSGIVMARHDTTAQGICAQNHVEYRQARDMGEVEQAINWLTEDYADNTSKRARLLEVLTDIDEDAKALKEQYELIDKKTWQETGKP